MNYDITLLEKSHLHVSYLLGLPIISLHLMLFHFLSSPYVCIIVTLATTTRTTEHTHSTGNRGNKTTPTHSIVNQLHLEQMYNISTHSIEEILRM